MNWNWDCSGTVLDCIIGGNLWSKAKKLYLEVATERLISFSLGQTTPMAFWTAWRLSAERRMSSAYDQGLVIYSLFKYGGTCQMTTLIELLNITKLRTEPCLTPSQTRAWILTLPCKRIQIKNFWYLCHGQVQTKGLTLLLERETELPGSEERSQKPFKYKWLKRRSYFFLYMPFKNN